MIKHNFILFLRNIRQNKNSFFINIVGLSTGLICFLFIALWIEDEISVDKFHQNDSRLYQVMKTNKSSNRNFTSEWTPGPLAKTLPEEMPEIVYATNVLSEENGIISPGNGKEIRARELYAGKDFFNIFSFELIDGNKDEVLSGNQAVVISDKLALKLFGTSENIIGRDLEWKQEELSGNYTISGVFKAPPASSSLQFDVIYSYEEYKDRVPDNYNWTYNDPHTYVVLKEGANIEALNSKMTRLIRERSNDETSSLFLTLFSSKHLYGKYENGVQAEGRITYVRLFSVIAILILLIACINFINLSTAQASKRIKEVGVKKAMGIKRRSLGFQFLGESIMTSFLALLTALLFVVIFLPQFNQIVGKELQLDLQWPHIVFLLAVSLLVGLVSGSYPALYLSGFKPVSLLKGKFTTRASELWIRQGLVIFQFGVSVVLIVSVIVIYQQIEYIQTKNLGYEKDNIIYLRREGKMAEKLETSLNEIKNIPGVTGATSYAHNLTGDHGTTIGLDAWEGKDPEDNIAFSYINAYYDFIEVLGMELKEGRSFSRDFSTDEDKIILNETAVAQMGLKNPVGQIVELWGRNREIVGVVGDFHFESLYEEVKPCFYKLSDSGNHIMIKIEAGREESTLNSLKAFYSEYNPGFPFDFEFLDKDYQHLYQSEQRVSVLSKYFAGMAIIISCLGLFGLVAFTAERRQKEIGIRKALGQSSSQITMLLSGEFAKLVGISILVGIPVAYLLSINWLTSFAYKIDLRLWYFILAGIGALVVALLTVSSQAIRAAFKNPVEALREE
ncbi:FtsX-like permease family protein [Leptobacterium flavescens]|uniref:FtsX-like permease family protein n=1 Tax=Leptobacterium flavescens TaxID=472055 RepID=A0A6P0UKE3_9FLAO|nr:ABC transporter permease [Leptobacterium flavescens]NER13022.1 FtsX-like permease family protein [Leptobacterium flavescens]